MRDKPGRSGTPCLMSLTWPACPPLSAAHPGLKARFHQPRSQANAVRRRPGVISTQRFGPVGAVLVVPANGPYRADVRNAICRTRATAAMTRPPPFALGTRPSASPLSTLTHHLPPTPPFLVRAFRVVRGSLPRLPHRSLFIVLLSPATDHFCILRFDFCVLAAATGPHLRVASPHPSAIPTLSHSGVELISAAGDRSW